MSKSIDPNIAAAKAALEKRQEVIAERDAVYNDSSLNAPQKRAALMTIDRRMEELDTEAKGHLRQAELESEARAAAQERETEVRTAHLAGTAPARRVGASGSQGEYRLGEALSVELRAVTGASGTGAAWTPSEFGGYFFDRLSAQSVLLSSGVNVIKTDRDSLVIPRLTGDITTAWLSEGQTMTPSDPTGDSLTATPRKFGGMDRLSNEVVEDSNPAILDAFGASLARSAALQFDIGAFEGTGTAPEIRGLKNVAGIGSVSVGTNGGTPTNLDPIADALSALLTANAFGPPVIVCHPRTWQTFLKLKEASGSIKPVVQESWGSIGQAPTRSLYGAPVFLSSKLSITETQGTSTDCSSIYVYVPTQLYVVTRKEPEITVNRDVYFESDQVGIRILARMDLIVPNPAAVVRIQGIRP